MLEAITLAKRALLRRRLRHGLLLLLRATVPGIQELDFERGLVVPQFFEISLGRESLFHMFFKIFLSLIIDLQMLFQDSNAVLWLVIEVNFSAKEPLAYLDEIRQLGQAALIQVKARLCFIQGGIETLLFEPGELSVIVFQLQGRRVQNLEHFGTEFEHSLSASARLKNDYPQRHREEASPSLSKTDLPHGRTSILLHSWLCLVKSAGLRFLGTWGASY